MSQRALNAYLECALWTATNEAGDPLDNEFGTFDFDEKTRDEADFTVGNFLAHVDCITAAWELLPDVLPLSESVQQLLVKWLEETHRPQGLATEATTGVLRDALLELGIEPSEENMLGLAWIVESKTLPETPEDWSPARTAYGEADLGHDLWLTRNGHGSGFWDKPEKYGPLTEVFDVLAQDEGEATVMVVDPTNEDFLNVRAAEDLEPYLVIDEWGRGHFGGLSGFKVDQETKYKKKQRCLYCQRELWHTQFVKFGPPQEYRWIPERHLRPDGRPCSNEPERTWKR